MNWKWAEKREENEKQGKEETCHNEEKIKIKNSFKCEAKTLAKKKCSYMLVVKLLCPLLRSLNLRSQTRARKEDNEKRKREREKEMVYFL